MKEEELKNTPAKLESSGLSSLFVPYKNTKSLIVHILLCSISERDKIMNICLSSFMKLIYEPFLITSRNIYSTEGKQ